MVVLGIDPGPTESAYALVDDAYRIGGAGKVPNETLRGMIRDEFNLVGEVALECLQNYGGIVGKSIFQTAYWLGRFWEVAEQEELSVYLYPRPLIARSIIGGKFSDSALRQALLLRFGGDRKGEPLNKLKGSSDLRSAYAAAVYHIDGAKLGGFWTEAA